MRLSKNFVRSEFACRCGCGFDTIDTQTLDSLDALRDLFNSPIKINSAARCKKHNDEIGSNDKSQHRFGRAVDISVLGHSPKSVYNKLDEMFPNTFGLGLYGSFVHFDTREDKARWVG